MERLTHERVNGIKTGYWSAATEEALVQKLAAYENTGYEPDGGIWKLEAKKNIADYFLKNMGDLIDAGKVVVMQ